MVIILKINQANETRQEEEPTMMGQVYGLHVPGTEHGSLSFKFILFVLIIAPNVHYCSLFFRVRLLYNKSFKSGIQFCEIIKLFQVRVYTSIQ